MRRSQLSLLHVNDPKIAFVTAGGVEAAIEPQITECIDPAYQEASRFGNIHGTRLPFDSVDRNGI